jgi:hypothetical protein
MLIERYSLINYFLTRIGECSQYCAFYEFLIAVAQPAFIFDMLSPLAIPTPKISTLFLPFKATKQPAQGGFISSIKLIWHYAKLISVWPGSRLLASGRHGENVLLSGANEKSYTSLIA